MRKRSIVVMSCVAIVLGLLVAAGSSEAATESVVTLEIEFSGASCSLSTVVVSAASCDSDDIADELTSELESEGLSSAWCGYSVNDMWECFYVIPTGCTQDDVAMTLQPGSTCQYTPQGWISKPISIYGVFAFNVE